MDSFHTIIRKSQVSFVETLQKFAMFTPSEDLLRDLDISAILEDPRPVDAPQVRINILKLMLYGCSATLTFKAFFTFAGGH